MLPIDRTVCYCNDASVGDIVDLVKSKGIKTLQELLEQDELVVGDKCEQCHVDGYENDGVALASVLGLVQRGKL